MYDFCSILLHFPYNETSNASLFFWHRSVKLIMVSRRSSKCTLMRLGMVMPRFSGFLEIGSRFGTPLYTVSRKKETRGDVVDRDLRHLSKHQSTLS